MIADIVLAANQDIEDDLATSTMRVLPRLMYRLLVTLTQDRKMTYVSFSRRLPTHLTRVLFLSIVSTLGSHL